MINIQIYISCPKLESNVKDHHQRVRESVSESPAVPSPPPAPETAEMLEGNPDAGKRNVTPSQRNNRPLNRRKSTEKFEKVNYPHAIEGEKGQGSHSRNLPTTDHREAGVNSDPGIPLNGCSNSEASQLLNERWTAAMNSYNDPSINISEKPIMYSGASGSSWAGNIKLPHQMKQMDFLGELRRAVQNSPANSAPTTGDRADFSGNFTS